MKFSEICEHVISGEMTLDFMGHPACLARDDFVRHYEHLVENANGKNDGQWSSCGEKGADVAKVNADMRQHFQMQLDRNYEEGDDICTFGDAVRCHGCAKRLNWVVVGKKLRLQQYWSYDKETGKGNFVRFPDDYICPYAQPRVTRGQINIASKLIFANFFLCIEDSPEDLKYTEEWSLNHLIGRENITQYKVERNVAYGQMGNMAIGIFLSPDKKSIIIGNAYIADKLMDGMTDEEADAADYDTLSVIEGHQLVGHISLAVWRWEATDQNTLGDKYQAEKDNQAERCQEWVELDVPFGVWEFEHYYRIETEQDEDIYARLKLKA